MRRPRPPRRSSARARCSSIPTPPVTANQRNPKPVGADRVRIYKELANNTLASPDTWEVELSAGKDKKETFTRLLTEKKLAAKKSTSRVITLNAPSAPP